MMRAFLFLAAALVLAANRAEAMDYDVGTIHIGQPWAPATPKGASVAAGYMTVTNNGAVSDRLTCTSASFAAQCQVHSMTMEGGIMHMRPLPNGVEIKPGETVQLKPNSLHLMFMGVKQPLEKGTTVKVTLKLEKAGTIDVDYAVGAIGGASSATKPPMGGMQMH